MSPRPPSVSASCLRKVTLDRHAGRDSCLHALGMVVSADMVVDDSVLAESYRVLRSRLDLSGLPPLTRAVTEAVLCATADFDFVTDLMCDEAILVVGGITDCPVICKATEPLAMRLARTTGITVAAAGVRLGFGEAGPGSVWVVGDAPDALWEILRRVTEPALVIGVPAGLIGAAEAKDELRASGVPALTTLSEKGGPVVAVAAFGALLRAARGEPAP